MTKCQVIGIKMAQEIKVAHHSSDDQCWKKRFWRTLLLNTCALVQNKP